MENLNMNIKSGKYAHYKGNQYEVIETAIHSETLEKLVVYRALYGERRLWVCPIAMWNELVEHEGQVVMRFALISE